MRVTAEMRWFWPGQYPPDLEVLKLLTNIG